MTPQDLNAVQAIQSLSPGAAQWSPQDYLVYRAWVACSAETVVGFIVLQIPTPEEGEVLNLAVHPAYRRHGTGTRLLESFPARLCLEVRASNLSAIAFYQANGFNESGRRQAYYSDPPEDAVLMVRERPPAANPY